MQSCWRQMLFLTQPKELEHCSCISHSNLPQNTWGNMVISLFHIHRSHFNGISKFPWPVDYVWEDEKLLCRFSGARGKLALFFLDLSCFFPGPWHELSRQSCNSLTDRTHLCLKHFRTNQQPQPVRWTPTLCLFQLYLVSRMQDSQLQVLLKVLLSTLVSIPVRERMYIPNWAITALYFSIWCT